MLYPYNHTKIIGAIKTNRKFDSLLMRVMMGLTLPSDKGTVGFDQYAGDMRIAPLMQPTGTGQVMSKEGYETVTLTPAYTKPKMSIKYQELIARPAGVTINGQVSTKKRYAQVLKENAQLLDGKIERLKAFMLSQLAVTGKIDITSPLYGNYTIDFQRPAQNTSLLAGPLRWGEAGISPVDTLEAFIGLMNRPARTIIMGATAWQLYRRDPILKDWMIAKNQERVGNPDKLALNPIQYEDVAYRKVGHHNLLGCDIYVDSSFVEIDGNKTMLLDPAGVLVIPEKNLGVMGYGAIQDAKAKFSPFEIFYKTYELDDPGIPFVQAQSAPVPFHMDIESTGYMKVR